MTTVFTPATGAVLISATESTPGASATVQAVPELPDVLDSITWVTDLPTAAVISVAGSTLTVSVPSFSALFPVLGIDYLLNGVLGTCYTWDDLPDEAEQVIAYRKSGTNLRTYSLTVNAQLVGGAIDSATYTIRVTANYDTGRDALVAAVNARR